MLTRYSVTIIALLMLRAVENDKDLVVNLLYKAFNHGQGSAADPINSERATSFYLRQLLSFSFEICCRFGEVWLADSKNGCILVLFPHLQRFDIKILWLKARLICASIKSKKNFHALRHFTKMEKKRSKIDMALIFYIAVDPDFQKTGIGTSLLNQTLRRLKPLDLPIYMEITNYRLLNWLERFGFEGYGLYDSQDDSNINFLLKKDLMRYN